jgi:hypothetical protein
MNVNASMSLTELQAAINGSVGYVRFAPGIYKLTGTLKLKTGLTYVGDGAVLTRPDGAGWCALTDVASGVLICGLIFVGGGLALRGVTDCSVVGCTFRDITKPGAAWSANQGLLVCPVTGGPVWGGKRIVITANRFSNIYLRGHNDERGTGIRCFDCDTLQVVGNTFDGVGQPISLVQSVAGVGNAVMVVNNYAARISRMGLEIQDKGAARTNGSYRDLLVSGNSFTAWRFEDVPAIGGASFGVSIATPGATGVYVRDNIVQSTLYADDALTASTPHLAMCYELAGNAMEFTGNIGRGVSCEFAVLEAIKGGRFSDNQWHGVLTGWDSAFVWAKNPQDWFFPQAAGVPHERLTFNNNTLDQYPKP